MDTAITTEGQIGPELLRKILAAKQRLVEIGPIRETGWHEAHSYWFSTDQDVLDPINLVCNDLGLLVLCTKATTRELGQGRPASKAMKEAGEPGLSGYALVDVTLLIADAESGQFLNVHSSVYAEDLSGDKSVSKAQTGVRKVAKLFFLLPSEERPKSDRPNGNQPQRDQSKPIDRSEPASKPKLKGATDQSQSEANGTVQEPAPKEESEHIRHIKAYMKWTGISDKTIVATICKTWNRGLIPSALKTPEQVQILRDQLFLYKAMIEYPLKFTDDQHAAAIYAEMLRTLPADVQHKTVFESWQRMIEGLPNARESTKPLAASVTA